MKKQLFNILTVLLAALVLIILYSAFWKTKDNSKHIKEQNPAPYIKEDTSSPEVEILTESRDERILTKRPFAPKQTTLVSGKKKNTPLSISYDTHEEMEEHTEDVYDALVPDTYEESIAKADEAFEVLDTHVSEVSKMMQEHQDISSLNQNTIDEMYQTDNDYEMELPRINE